MSGATNCERRDDWYWQWSTLDGRYVTVSVPAGLASDDYSMVEELLGLILRRLRREYRKAKEAEGEVPLP